MTSFNAMFSVDALGLDYELGLCYRIDKDPEVGDTLAQNLVELHLHLVGRRLKERDRAEKQYNKAIEAATYDLGERVVIYNPPLDLKKEGSSDLLGLARMLLKETF